MIKSERSKLSVEMLAKARETVQVELTDRNAELSTLKKRVKDSELAELNLRRRELKLKEQTDRVDIQVERKDCFANIVSVRYSFFCRFEFQERIQLLHTLMDQFFNRRRDGVVFKSGVVRCT